MSGSVRGVRSNPHPYRDQSPPFGGLRAGFRGLHDCGVDDAAS